MFSLRAFVLCCSVVGALSSSDELWGDYTGTSITPFSVNWTLTDIADLQRRLADERSPNVSLTDDFKYGFNAALLTNVSDYWANEYNFTARVEYANKYPQYIVTVQGIRVHVVRVQPEDTTNTTVVPLVITHSYPSYSYEFYYLISELTTKQCINGSAVEVIVIGMPGHVHSDAPNKPGCGAPQIATLVKNVMKVLGHESFFVHTNDCLHVGATIATMYPKNVLGLHTTTPVVLTPKAIVMWLVESLITSPESFAVNITKLMNGVLSYIHMLTTIPDTLAVAWSNSASGHLSIIASIVATINRPNNVDLYDGGLCEQFNKDEVLDVITEYWFTNSLGGASRTFAETFNWKNFMSGIFSEPTPVPTLVVDPEYFYMHMSRAQLQTKYSNLLGVEKMEGAGHYPAYEKYEETAASMCRFMTNVIEMQTTTS